MRQPHKYAIINEKIPTCRGIANCIGHESQRSRVKTWTLLLYPFLKGAVLMDNEKLKKLEHDQYVAEKKLTVAQHREKRLRNELSVGFTMMCDSKQERSSE